MSQSNDLGGAPAAAPEGERTAMLLVECYRWTIRYDTLGVTARRYRSVDGGC